MKQLQACHSEGTPEESTAPAVVLRVIPKDLCDRDPCAAAKALATRGRLAPQGDTGVSDPSEIPQDDSGAGSE